MASTLAKIEIYITEQVREKWDAMTFTMVNDVNFHTVQQLLEELADFASFFPSTAWGGGGHGYLPLLLSRDKMRVVANNNHLDCRCIYKPEFANPAITTDTKGRDLLKLQEEKLALWASFVYQYVVEQVRVKTIVTNLEKAIYKALPSKIH